MKDDRGSGEVEGFSGGVDEVLERCIFVDASSGEIFDADELLEERHVVGALKSVFEGVDETLGGRSFVDATSE